MADEVTFGSACDLLVRKLIQARKGRELTLEEVSAETRIKKDHLEKIEAGNLGFLPSAYVYAFLKEYAQALDVEDGDILAQCRDELSIPTDQRVREEKEAEAEEEAGSRGDRLSGMFDAVTKVKDRVPIAYIAGGAALIVVLLLVLSFFLFSGTSKDGQNNPQEETRQVEPQDDVAADSVTEPDEPESPPENASPELAVMQEEWAKGLSFLPESPASPYQKILVVRIINDLSWVKIIADDGDIVYPGGQFKAGEVLRYEAKRKFWVNIGRPPFVELYLNGEKVSPLSQKTVVLGEE